MGAILPDEDMPHWRGEPLEALIDPISVLNRSIWGQVYETLAGAVAADGLDEADALTGGVVLARAADLGADEHGRWWYFWAPNGSINPTNGGEMRHLTPAHVEALAATCGKPPADWVGMWAVILTEVEV